MVCDVSWVAREKCPWVYSKEDRDEGRAQDD